MADAPINVTVTYTRDATGKHAVNVDPSLIQVKPGQAIHFNHRGDLPGKMRIRFKERHFFENASRRFADSGAIQDDDGDVRAKTLTRRTEYVCELLDDSGGLIVRSAEGAGGAAEPVQGEPHGRDNKGGG